MKWRLCPQTRVVIDKVVNKEVRRMSEQVYYDPKSQVIFTVKRRLKRYVVIGGGESPYINDARSSYMRRRISNSYFRGCVPIDESSHLLYKDNIALRLRDDNQFQKVYDNSAYKCLKETDRIVKAHREEGW